MKEKQTIDIFNKIKQEDNPLLEAGIIEGVLKLRLTISQSSEVTNVYSGQIKNIEEHEKLKESFEAVSDIMKWISEPHNTRLDLSDMSVIILAKIGLKNFIEICRIKLTKEERQSNELGQLDELEHLIDRCCSKDELSNDQIKTNFQILSNQIIELKRQKKGKDQISQDLVNLKEEILKTVETSNSKTKQKYDIVFQEKANQINFLKQKIEKINEKNETLFLNFEKFQILASENIVNLENEYKTKTIQLEQQINILKELLNERIKQVETSMISSNISQKLQIMQSKMDIYVTKQTFYQQQKWSKLFKFNGKTLTKISENSWHQFVFFQFVPFDQEFIFKVKIIKSQQRSIKIGVVDYEKQKDQPHSYNSNNALCYKAANGFKYPVNIKEGNGVNVGQTVEVKVDRKNNSIRWMVNNQQRASYIHEMLGEQDRKFMPYVQMFNVKDTIEYIL